MKTGQYHNSPENKQNKKDTDDPNNFINSSSLTTVSPQDGMYTL